MTKTPYENLDPNLILDAIETLELKCSGSLLALNSYENRVYQVGILDADPVIVKFYRPNRWSDEAILEEHQFSKELSEHEIPVVAPLVFEDGKTLHHFQNYRFAIFPRKGGRALDIGNNKHLEWMGRFIGRIHAVGKSRPFQHRRKMNILNDIQVASKFIIENNFIPVELKKVYVDHIEKIINAIDNLLQRYDALQLIRVHGDCHLGNILWTETGPNIVDLDDCMISPAIQDLWMMLSGADTDESKIQLNYILNGYQDFCDFIYSEINFIEPLRTLRMITYTAWLAMRWEDPTFPLNFPWFNTYNYWRQHLVDLENQIAILNE